MLVKSFTDDLAWEVQRQLVNSYFKVQAKEPGSYSVSTDKSKLLEISEMNARVRMSNQLLKLSKVDTLSSEYKSILVSKASQVLTGHELLPLPQSEQRTYSASEIGAMFGVSSQKVGSIANRHGLKTREYGEFYRDKSPYSSKEVDSFRYYDSAVPAFKKLLEMPIKQYI